MSTYQVSSLRRYSESGELTVLCSLAFALVCPAGMVWNRGHRLVLWWTHRPPVGFRYRHGELSFVVQLRVCRARPALVDKAANAGPCFAGLHECLCCFDGRDGVYLASGRRTDRVDRASGSSSLGSFLAVLRRMACCRGLHLHGSQWSFYRRSDCECNCDCRARSSVLHKSPFVLTRWLLTQYTGLASINDPTYVAQRWQTCLIVYVRVRCILSSLADPRTPQVGRSRVCPPRQRVRHALPRRHQLHQRRDCFSDSCCLDGRHLGLLSRTQLRFLRECLRTRRDEGDEEAC